MTLISYTLPCHKREADLSQALPTVLRAADRSLPVEIVVVDYGNPVPLDPSVRTVRVEREHFHMAHARNVGIMAARGDIVVAFLSDQLLAPDFFRYVRETMRQGLFLRWFETFAFNRDEIVDAGGFDERFEFYGPEGKELTDRLERRGLRSQRIPDRYVSQIPTPNELKTKNYRLKMSKRTMHYIGKAIWDENRARGLTVANAGMEWGASA